MPYTPIKPAAIETAGEYVLVPCIQGMENTATSSFLRSLAIQYQENQLADPDLWDSIFALISIFGVDQYIKNDAQNIICFLYRIVLFIK